MRILERRILRGPNMHTWRPCIQIVLDLQALDNVSSADLSGFTARLTTLMPSLYAHRCSVGRVGGFVQRLHAGTYMAHVVEHVALELQCLAGSQAGFGRARKMALMPRCYRVVCAYQIEALIVPAMDAAIDLVTRVAAGASVDLESLLHPLRRLVQRHGAGPSTAGVLQAARKRRIPIMRLDDNSNLYQLGYGARQRRFQATMTGDTSQIATRVASNKQLVRKLLERAGIPVAKGVEVKNEEAAVRAAACLGGHVVLKPADSNHGNGVTTLLDDPAGIRSAYGRARRFSRRVLVERFINGCDYRVLVVGGKFVAAARRDAACVYGDGRSTIAQLIDRENQNPLRGDGHSQVLTRIPQDEGVVRHLARQAWTLESVAPPGMHITLTDTANLSTGGAATDVTDDVHPRIVRACVRAARLVGLDVAGVDLICGDIGVPLEAQGGAIIEVNAAPGLRMHEFPSAGARRAVARAIVDHLFPEGDGRIPIIAVTGTNGKTTTVLLIDAVLSATGLTVARTTTNGVAIGGEQIHSGDCAGYWSACAVLSDPEVDMAVLETARGGIVKRGLAFDRCDVAVVTNISADHLGQDGVNTVQQLAKVKAVVARAARKALVLNVQDDLCVAMAKERRAGTEVLYFSLDVAHPLFQQHIAQGHRGVAVSDGIVVWAQHGQLQALFSTNQLPVALGGLATHNVSNVLAAVAALMASNACATDDIVSAMTSFVPSEGVSPVRLNLYDAEGVTVLFDYAHNPVAYEAILDTARALGAGRIVGVISAPTNREQTLLDSIGRICARALDEIITYEPDDSRGRVKGATCARLASAAIEEAQGRIPVKQVSDVREAIRSGFERCRPGDLLLIGGATQLTELHDALASVHMRELSMATMKEAVHE